ncbi:MAG: class I SAM-dependent methyltransferase [Endomicrobia bacterium]|nr:class I SAM-dependent methyltransferase [Endomicrobiia bacterium]
MEEKIDWNLKFFKDVLGLESLHFGYWQHGQKLTLEEFKVAQKNYTNLLISKIPLEVKTILDVGCGTGEIAGELVERGFQVECISPDSYQHSLFIQKHINAKFYLTKFEDFVADKKYDLILMAESCQYIPLDKMFKKLEEVLSPDGYLLVSDYFRKENLAYYKTTHLLKNFYSFAIKHKFKIIYDEDITDNVIPTLTLAKMLYLRYALPLLEILTGYFSERFPVLSKMLSLILHSLIKKVRHYVYDHMLNKLDEEKFKKSVTYSIE